MEFEKAIKWVIGIICCIGVILAIALPVASLKSLEPTEVGLDYSTTSVSLDESQLYTSGRHFIGVAHEFVIYNTQNQRIELTNIVCRTSDGLYIQLSSSFQYTIKATLADILDLFYLWPYDGYVAAYENIAINVFRDVVSNFTAFDFVYNRSTIESQLLTYLRASIQIYHSDIQNFQLMEVDFPSSFSSAISDTTSANLSIQNAYYNQTTVQNQVEGLIIKAQTDAIVIVNNANISAVMASKKAEAEILSTTERLSRQITSLSTIKANLNLSTDGLINYVWLKSIEAINEKTSLSLNLRVPPIIKCLNEGEGSCSIY